MPAKVIHELNLRDFTYVLANLRPEDEREISALMPVNMDRAEYVKIMAPVAFEGLAYTVHIEGNPEAAFGVGISGSFATAQGWAFGTSRFKRAAPTISHFIWNYISHELHSAGVLRLEARAMDTHTYSRNWLKKMGFHEDCALPYYGSRGETFFLYSLTLEDYNKRFSGRLN